MIVFIYISVQGNAGSRGNNGKDGPMGPVGAPGLSVSITWSDSKNRLEEKTGKF